MQHMRVRTSLTSALIAADASVSAPVRACVCACVRMRACASACALNIAPVVTLVASAALRLIALYFMYNTVAPTLPVTHATPACGSYFVV